MTIDQQVNKEGKAEPAIVGASLLNDEWTEKTITRYSAGSRETTTRTNSNHVCLLLRYERCGSSCH